MLTIVDRGWCGGAAERPRNSSSVSIIQGVHLQGIFDVDLTGCATALNNLRVDDLCSLGSREYEPTLPFSLIGHAVQVLLLEQPRFVLLEGVCDDVRPAGPGDP